MLDLVDDSLRTEETALAQALTAVDAAHTHAETLRASYYAFTRRRRFSSDAGRVRKDWMRARRTVATLQREVAAHVERLERIAANRQTWSNVEAAAV